jgi:hypothetical protein
MKKMWMMLIALVLLTATLPVFASDVTFSGVMTWEGNINADSVGTGHLIRFRPELTAKVDDFNTLFVQLRADSATVLKNQDFYFHDLKLTTDITGALKLNLPFTVKTIVGYFEPGFTDWAYASESGWENYYDWPNKLADVGPNQPGGMQLDIGAGPVVVHYYSDFDAFNMMLGLSGGFGPITGWLTYQITNAAFGDGIFGIEAKYAGEFGGLKVGVPVFFRYEMNAVAPKQDYTFGAGVSADYSMFHVAAGLEGDSDNALDNVVVDLSVKPLDAMKVYGHMYMDLGKDYIAGATASLTGIDLGVSYKFGAPTFMLGYVIGNDDHTAIPIYGDTFGIASGVYLAVDVKY